MQLYQKRVCKCRIWKGRKVRTTRNRRDLSATSMCQERAFAGFLEFELLSAGRFTVHIHGDASIPESVHKPVEKASDLRQPEALARRLVSFKKTGFRDVLRRAYSDDRDRLVDEDHHSVVRIVLRRRMNRLETVERL